MEALDRLLELARRELGADRASLEYASAPPREAHALWTDLKLGWRLVVDFTQAPEDRASVLLQLQALAASFDHVIADAQAKAPTPTSHHAARVGLELQETLNALAQRIRATAVWVIDDRSPIVWGASGGGTWITDAEQARSLGHVLSGLDPDNVLHWIQGQELPPPPSPLAPRLSEVAAALGDAPDPQLGLASFAGLAGAAAHSSDWSASIGTHRVFSRPFCAIYRVVALFGDEFSELHAQTTLGRALPILERLITEHPPIDPTPTPKGARIHVFRRPL